MAAVLVPREVSARARLPWQGFDYPYQDTIFEFDAFGYHFRFRGDILSSIGSRFPKEDWLDDRKRQAKFESDGYVGLSFRGFERDLPATPRIAEIFDGKPSHLVIIITVDKVARASPYAERDDLQFLEIRSAARGEAPFDQDGYVMTKSKVIVSDQTIYRRPMDQPLWFWGGILQQIRLDTMFALEPRVLVHYQFASDDVAPARRRELDLAIIEFVRSVVGL